jgi:shikimate kinase
MNPAPNLVFVGPMGAGKTTIGKRVALRLGLTFVDADHRLEELTGAPVPLIFECEGEAGFRARESALIAELCNGSGQLIATGGGAVLSAENRRCLRERGFVVFLQVSVAQQLQRLARDRSRPLLASGNKQEKLQALAKIREPIYLELADLVFDSDGPSLAHAADQLGDLVESHWQRAKAA